MKYTSQYYLVPTASQTQGAKNQSACDVQWKQPSTDPLCVLEVIHKTKERHVAHEGCRGFKGSQRSEETGKVMRVKAAVCRRRREETF